MGVFILPRCLSCNKRGLFLHLENGLCESCLKERRYYSMEFDNEMRILNESMQIIKRTKNLDTLLSRKDLCFRTFDRLSFLNDRYKFIPSYSMPVRGDIIRACELCEKKLIASEQESKFRSEICISLNDIICDCVKESSGLHSSEPQEQIPFEISEFANSIFSSYVSLYPWNQGIDMNFKIHPENVDRAIACYRSQIQYFYAQKDEFASLGEPYVKAWENASIIATMPENQISVWSKPQKNLSICLSRIVLFTLTQTLPFLT